MPEGFLFIRATRSGKALSVKRRMRGQEEPYADFALHAFSGIGIFRFGDPVGIVKPVVGRPSACLIIPKTFSMPVVSAAGGHHAYL